MEVKEQDYLEYGDILEHYGVPGMKWGRRKSKVTTLDRYKKHKKTEKQYNEDKILYGKKGTKRIADDMDNKVTLKGARSKEAARFNTARRDFSKSRRIGEKVGANTGALVGYATIYAGRKLTSKILKNGGKLNSFGEVIDRTDPFITYTLGGLAGSYIGRRAGKSIGGRVSARKNGYEYEHLKKRK